MGGGGGGKMGELETDEVHLLVRGLNGGGDGDGGTGDEEMGGAGGGGGEGGTGGGVEFDSAVANWRRAEPVHRRARK